MYRTDAAEYVIVYIVRSVIHLYAICGLAGNIIGDMDQDNIIIFPILKILNDLVVKLMDQVVIF